MSPLTVLKSELEFVLRKTHEQDEQRKTFEIMSEQTERMIKIVRTLLILAKEDDAGRQEQTVFNLSKLLNGMQEVFIHNNLELKVENGLYVRGNSEYFSMAIQNIMDNAFKYSEPDAPVTISAASNGRKVIITVCDTGVGIPADQRDRIFDRFYRFDTGVKGERSGVGLGLSLAKAIVSTMNGTIEISDNRPKGSCFTISLQALSVQANSTNIAISAMVTTF